MPYREPGQRERHEYRLTEKGLDLITAVIALMHGDRWEAGPDGPPVQVLPPRLRTPRRATLHCPHDNTTVTARDLQPVPGPGAHLAPATQ